MNEKKKYLILTAICGGFMFLWIFLTMALTGGRDMQEFTDLDKKIFFGFLILEVITVILTFFFATKAGKASPKPAAPAVPKTQYDKLLRRRAILLPIRAGALCLFAQLLGIALNAHFPEEWMPPFRALLWFCSLAPLPLLLLNLLFTHLGRKRLDQMDARAFVQFMNSHREDARQMTLQKLQKLQKLRIASNLYALLFAIFGAGTAFSSGVLYNSNYSTALLFLAAFYLLCALSRVRYPIPPVLFEEDKCCIKPEDYPELYALAQKAADTMHCGGSIKIILSTDFNAGILKADAIYSLTLGVVLLQMLSKEELYSVLLHEFAHMSGAEYRSEKENAYHFWISNGGTAHFLSNLTAPFFRWFDSEYCLQYLLYDYASAILIETEADLAMARDGMADYAASALLKLKYHELYCWENSPDGTEQLLYAAEQPKQNLMEEEAGFFRKAMVRRAADWNGLIGTEILSRSATHPTLKMRLDQLGITELRIVESKDSDSYLAERKKAVKYLDELICQDRLETYEEDRQKLYLDPLKDVTAWEEAGKPLVPEQYADLDCALRMIGRYSEANALCDRAIAELPDAASCYAYYTKGCFLLQGYQEEGLGYVYHAMESNNNFVKEGLEIIGQFCCLTGRQEELDSYRENAVDYAQRQKDLYEEIGVLRKNDRLSAEQLPEGMLEDILRYISSIDEAAIRNIYLVRKTITEDFSTSAFIIRFVPQTADDTQYDVMHKIFRHLDTCSDWQFSLFDYEEVKKIKVEGIAGSCVFTKQ